MPHGWRSRSIGRSRFSVRCPSSMCRPRRWCTRRRTAGILLLAIVGVEWGGTYMLSIVRGRQQVTGFQRSFHRAGHAHAGVLVILSLVSLVIIDAADLSGLSATLARNTIPLAAILF